MLRRVKWVTCPHCSHRFMAADTEDNATAESMPVYCPKCGREVSLSRLGNLIEMFLKGVMALKPSKPMI